MEMKKILAINIILLFIGVAFTSSINLSVATASQSNQLISSYPSSTERSVRLVVSEYRPDGTIKRIPVKMSQEDCYLMVTELETAHSLDEQLSVYKKYNIIPKNVTSEKLLAGMVENTKKSDGAASQKSLSLSYPLGKMNSPLSSFPVPVLWENYTTVYGIHIASLRLHVGFSFFRAHVNSLLYFLFGDTDFYIHSKELLTVYWSLGGGRIETANSTFSAYLGMTVIMKKFVGYIADFSPFFPLTPTIVAVIFPPVPFMSFMSFYSGYVTSVRAFDYIFPNPSLFFKG